MTTYPQAVAALTELAAIGDPDVFEEPEYAGWAHRQVFTKGGCALYATALVRAHPDWSVVAAGEPTCVETDEDPDLRPCDDFGHGVCGCHVHHFYAESPDGMLHDIDGEHDPTGVLQDRTLHPITDTSLRCVIESWHVYASDWDAGAAALAVALTDPVT